MRVHDVLRDGETEAGTSARTRAVALVEALEDPVQVRAIDPAAGVAHRELDPWTVRDRSQCDQSSRGRELHCVMHEVGEDLPDPFWVRADVGQVGSSIDLERDVGTLGQGRHPPRGVPQELPGIHLCQREPIGTRLDPGEREQLLYELSEPVDLLLHPRDEVPRDRAVVDRPALQRLRDGLERRDRGPQLV